ncbi:MAG: SMC-Scp complex subunit ScpB [Thermoguttaceae bacterium]
MKKVAPLQMVPFVPPVDEMGDDDVADDGDMLSFDTLREAFRRTAAETREPENQDDAASYDGDEVADDVEDEDIASDNVAEDVTSADAADVATCREVSLSPRVILEAMLFVGDRENRPLAPERAAELMRNVTAEEVAEAAKELEASYRAAGAPYTVVESGGGYRLALRGEWETLRSKFSGKVREATLSQKAIDSLAVVAYRQPVSAEEIDKLRKEPSAAIMTQLVRRGLVEQTKEKRGAKRTIVYRTTDRFLKLFGLATLDDLPQTDEIDFR